MNTHPDYMAFGNARPDREEYSARLYEDILKYVSDKYREQYWHALPRDVARFWIKQCGEIK